MDITEHQIPLLDNKPKPYKKNRLPTSDNPYLPPVYCSILAVASKNCGKTFGIAKLFHHYEKYPFYDPEDSKKIDIKVVWFSPTVQSKSNTILETVKQLDLENDVVDEYSEDKLQEKIDEVQQIKKDIEEYDQYRKHYTRWMKVGEDRLTMDELELLYKYDFQEPDVAFGNLKYKKPPVVFFVFDDLISDNKAFNTKKNNKLSNFLIKHRHYGINMIFTTQNLKSIPKVVRNNIDVYMIYRCMNKKVIMEGIYDEISGLVKPEVFEQLYEHCIQEKYNWLTVNNHPRCPDDGHFLRCWHRILDF